MKCRSRISSATPVPVVGTVTGAAAAAGTRAPTGPIRGSSLATACTGAAASSIAQLRPPKAIDCAVIASDATVTTSPSGIAPDEAWSASHQNTTTLPTSTRASARSDAALAQPGGGVLELEQVAPLSGEPVDRPAGQPEQPHLLGRRGLDREVVGVRRVAAGPG